MSDTKNLRDKELEQVSGGVFVTHELLTSPFKVKCTEVDDIVVGCLYKRSNSLPTYAKVISFNGYSEGMVRFMTGTMQADGRVHKDTPLAGSAVSDMSYYSFKGFFDVSNSLSGEYWVD